MRSCHSQVSKCLNTLCKDILFYIFIRYMKEKCFQYSIHHYTILTSTLVTFLDTIYFTDCYYNAFLILCSLCQVNLRCIKQENPHKNKDRQCPWIKTVQLREKGVRVKDLATPMCDERLQVATMFSLTALLLHENFRIYTLFYLNDLVFRHLVESRFKIFKASTLKY